MGAELRATALELGQRTNLGWVLESTTGCVPLGTVASLTQVTEDTQAGTSAFGVRTADSWGMVRAAGGRAEESMMLSADGGAQALL